jgi:hypothetical protein
MRVSVLVNPLDFPAVKQVAVLLLALALAGAGCAQQKIALRYDYAPGLDTRYLWTIDSTTALNSPTDQSSKHLLMQVDVHEKVQRTAGRGRDSRLTITLTPRSLQEDRVRAKTPPPTKIEYQLGPNGQIRRPVTAELSEREASALELGTLLTQSRLALPNRPVGVGDRWNTPLELSGDTGTIEFKGQGRLVGFDLRSGRRLARIKTDRSGEITAQEQLAGVFVLLRGQSKSTATSMLDLDRGILYSSVSRFASNFDLAEEQSGKLAGTLRVTLVSTFQLQPG